MNSYCALGPTNAIATILMCTSVACYHVAYPRHPLLDHQTAAMSQPTVYSRTPPYLLLCADKLLATSVSRVPPPPILEPVGAIVIILLVRTVCIFTDEGHCIVAETSVSNFLKYLFGWCAS